MSLLSGILDHLKEQAEGGIIKGVKRGLDYVRQTEEIAVWAIETGNLDALSDVGNVFKQWLMDTYDESRNLLPEVEKAALAVLEGRTPKIDPWEPDRKLAQALWDKWAGPAGLL